PSVMNASGELTAAGCAELAETGLNTAIAPTGAKMTTPRVRRWTSIAGLLPKCIRPSYCGCPTAAVCTVLRLALDYGEACFPYSPGVRMVCGGSTGKPLRRIAVVRAGDWPWMLQYFRSRTGGGA